MKLRLVLILVHVVLGLDPIGARAAEEVASTSVLRNRADFEVWMKELSNWGRWGPEDELGALNLVTPAKRQAAAALVREGVSVSCARLVEKEKAADNGAPFQHLMDRAGTNNPGYSSADTFRMSYHGLAHTHIDSLCHMFHQGRLYNGYPQSGITSEGAQRLGIANLKNGIVSRGILIDLPLLKGVEFLEPGTAIYPADLIAWEQKTGLKVGAGDVVLIRTGRWARRLKLGPWSGSFAGLHGSCARWLRERDVAVLGSDAAADVLPSGVEGVAMPLHQLCLVAMGTWILDNCDLEALSQAAGQRQRWVFMLTVAPLTVPGGTGSPVNPIAVF
ncbi:MAG: cyclase family protein [Verrucomicrobia bacterium]|nr:cyclase family protein [Verrucomicrobiota bacterium]